MRLMYHCEGSIPACTGKPTYRSFRVSEGYMGRQWSIPACTGKPLKGFVIFCSPFACGDPLEIPSVPTSRRATEGLVVLHQVDAVGIHDVLRRFAKCTYTLFAHGRRVSPSHDYRALP